MRVAGRPGRRRLFTPFMQVVWHSGYECLDGYEYAEDGRMRDRWGNFVHDHAPDHQVHIRIDNGRKKAFDRRELLATEWFGKPPREECYMCGSPFRYVVVHLDGNRGNCHRDNIKWSFDGDSAWHHGRNCTLALMREPWSTPWSNSNYVAGVHAPECRCSRCRG